MQYQNHLGQHFAGVNLCVQRRLGDSHGEVVYAKDYVVHIQMICMVKLCMANVQCDLHGEVVHANK